MLCPVLYVNRYADVRRLQEEVLRDTQSDELRSTALSNAAVLHIRTVRSTCVRLSVCFEFVLLSCFHVSMFLKTYLLRTPY